MYERHLLCNKIVPSMQQFTPMYLPNNSLLCTYPKERKNIYINIRTCTWMFITTLFIIAQVQDGGVEGHALTPYYERTRITTNCWTIIDRKTLELTKKDTPHTKTKEKAQWDGRRGTISIKLNAITARRVTHKLENNYTTEVHPLEWRFWAPRQASQPGGLVTGGGIPRESDLEG